MSWIRANIFLKINWWVKTPWHKYAEVVLHVFSPVNGYDADSLAKLGPVQKPDFSWAEPSTLH